MTRHTSILSALAICCSALPAHAGFYIETIRLLPPAGGPQIITFTEPHSAPVTHLYPGDADSAVSVTFSSDPAPYVDATARAPHDDGNSSVQARVLARLDYSFDVSGAPGTFVPVLFKGRLEIHNDSYLPNTLVSAAFSADGAGGATSYLLGERVRLFTNCTGNLTNGVPCYSESMVGGDGEQLGDRSIVRLSQGTVAVDVDGGASVAGTFEGILMTPVSVLGKGGGSVRLDVETMAISFDAQTTGILSWGFIDPELRIDPQYLAAHPGASLTLPDGVGAELLVGPVPEASTLAMMLGGLGLVGLAAARRRKA